MFVNNLHNSELFCSLSLVEETFPLLSDHSFIPEFHQEIIQQGSWENQGMCACVRFAWALALRSCSQWPNAVGAIEVLEEDEGVLDLAIDESVFGFLRYSVLGAANFHQEVHVQGLVDLYISSGDKYCCQTGRLKTEVHLHYICPDCIVKNKTNLVQGQLLPTTDWPPYSRSYLTYHGQVQ